MLGVVIHGKSLLELCPGYLDEILDLSEVCDEGEQNVVNNVGIHLFVNNNNINN